MNVIHELGKYGAAKVFHTLGASYDGASWLIPLATQKSGRRTLQKRQLTVLFSNPQSLPL